jgi:hypothetical protein
VDEDSQYASRLLTKSRQLYTCAMRPRSGRPLLQDAVPEVLPQYKSWGSEDELGWATAWLYSATKEEKYSQDFKGNLGGSWEYEGWAMSWDDLNAASK